MTEVLGSTTPRIATPPLVTGPPGPCGCGCALTPETSQGFAFITFCDEIVRQPLDPWQRWLAIHGLELLPDGRPRFRQILVLVSRQNGKTEFLVLLSGFWLYVLGVGMVLGTSTKLDYAKESWLKLLKLVKRTPELRVLTPDSLVRRANGEQEIGASWSGSGEADSRYKIAASNEEGGRSLTVHRLIEDELRQHYTWDAHEAAENAMQAVDDAQAWAISNAGSARAVVLNSLRSAGLAFIESGIGDERLGLFEWSAPEGVDVTDLAGLAQANPNLGRRIQLDSLIGKARRARDAGGEQEAKFRTEVLCQAVDQLEGLRTISAKAWDLRADEDSSVGAGRQPVFTFDVHPDQTSAAIGVGGYREDGRVHVGLVAQRPGVTWLVDELERLAGTRDPAAIVLDGSNAGALGLATLLEERGIRRRSASNPHGRLVVLSAGEVARACVGTLRAVIEDTVRHRGDPIVREALAAAEAMPAGDGGWRFARRKSGDDITPAYVVTLADYGAREFTEPEAFDVDSTIY